MGFEKSYRRFFFVFFFLQCVKSEEGERELPEKAGENQSGIWDTAPPLIDNSPLPPTTADAALQTNRIVQDVDRDRSLQATRIRFGPLPPPQIRHRHEPNRTILLPRRRLLFRPRTLLSMGHDCRCGHVAGRS